MTLWRDIQNIVFSSVSVAELSCASKFKRKATNFEDWKHSFNVILTCQVNSLGSLTAINHRELPNKEIRKTRFSHSDFNIFQFRFQECVSTANWHSRVFGTLSYIFVSKIFLRKKLIYFFLTKFPKNFAYKNETQIFRDDKYTQGNYLNTKFSFFEHCK